MQYPINTRATFLIYNSVAFGTGNVSNRDKMMPLCYTPGLQISDSDILGVLVENAKRWKRGGARRKWSRRFQDLIGYACDCADTASATIIIKLGYFFDWKHFQR